MITLEANGVDYSGFESIQVFRSFTNMAGAFSFTASSDKSVGMSFPIKLGDRCKVFVDKQSIINGFIENMSISYDQGQHVITIEGRDKTCDVIDSTINSKVIYNPPITFKRVIQNVLNALSIADIKVVENTSVSIFKDGEIQSAKVGETYFSFLDKLAKLKQVVLTTDGSGNIVIDRSSKKQINTILLHKKANENNNIITSTSNFTNTKRFNLYRSYSQGNPTAMIDIPQKPSDIVNRVGTTAIDKEIRKTRQFNFIADSSSDIANLNQRAAWEENIRRAQSRTFTCTVQGFIAQNDNILWRPNLLVKIDDDFTGTHGLFLIKDVTYRVSTSGSFTDLMLVTKDAFTLQAEQDARDARVNTQGQGFIDNPRPAVNNTIQGGEGVFSPEKYHGIL